MFVDPAANEYSSLLSFFPSTVVVAYIFESPSIGPKLVASLTFKLVSFELTNTSASR
ncbi:hypothetical protein KPL37_00865 [Clostridium frigoris]|uniref:Uncharacterized protein n=1 Tax=Clostridium frigoris TaxID=205327 RepID=A0ABS6BPH9_9CLOT|nr:hypothetical protein [Clostridium frigoris]MBU3158324.1 hypothetical protein [Clostridium frigoris]